MTNAVYKIRNETLGPFEKRATFLAEHIAQQEATV